MIYRGKKRKLIMSDGSEYVGYGFGEDEKDRVCELVFNTSPVGYQEIMSDPSYTDQFVTMAYPLIGNYGINDDDNETAHPTIGGFVVRDYNDEPSNFRCAETLSDTMKRFHIPGIYGVDTRKITRSIRDLGSRKVLITNADTPDDKAAKILKAGGLVAFPTETVYGLGGDALMPSASRHIYAAKGRRTNGTCGRPLAQ